MFLIILFKSIIIGGLVGVGGGGWGRPDVPRPDHTRNGGVSYLGRVELV